MENIITKNYPETYQFGMVKNYEAKIFELLMKSETINKADTSFDDIRYEVKKRQVTSSLVKVLDSKNVILLDGSIVMDKSFKVLVAKDIKSDNKLKVFIDCNGIIYKKDGRYVCQDIDIFIAYLLSAMNKLIYYSDPKRIVMNQSIIKDGAECFSAMFTSIVDNLEKISIVSSTKNKCMYLSALYYQVNILNKEITDSVKGVCRKISGLSEREEEIIFIQLEDNSLLNIRFFVDTVAKILKLNKIALETFLHKWIYLYGTGTQFALELYPSFAEMITNAYVGCYINNQKTIEKVTGRNMVNFTNTIFKIGAESI